MKARKILSSLLAATLASAYLMSFVNVANAADEITVNTTVQELTAADNDVFNKTFGYDITDLGESAHVYKVVSTVSDINAAITITSGRGGSKVYNGSVVKVASLTYKFNPSCVYSDEYGDVTPMKSANDSNALGMAAAGAKKSDVAQLAFATSAEAEIGNLHPYKEALASGSDSTFDSFTVEGIIVTNTDTFDLDVEAVVDVATVTKSALGSTVTKGVIYTPAQKITVKPADVPAVITVKPDTAEMILGNTVELTASNDKDVKLTYKYESSNTEVATVDDNGVVKAVGVGEATITVSAEGATPAECAINVRKAKVGDTDISDKKIKFLESKLVNIGNHNQLIYITKGDETRVSDKTIGEILGGEWVEGSTVEGTIAIGVISESPLDAFSFEIK